MSKQKARASPAQLTGLYKADSIRVCLITCGKIISRIFRQDVAESLNIVGLSDDVASSLASDVEYRIHQVVEVRMLTALSTMEVLTYGRLSGSCKVHASRQKNDIEYFRH